jgi:hypothetical protein
MLFKPLFGFFYGIAIGNTIHDYAHGLSLVGMGRLNPIRQQKLGVGVKNNELSSISRTMFDPSQVIAVKFRNNEENCCRRYQWN